MNKQIRKFIASYIFYTSVITQTHLMGRHINDKNFRRQNTQIDMKNTKYRLPHASPYEDEGFYDNKKKEKN